MELKRLRTQEVSKRALGLADQVTGGMLQKKSSLSFFKKMGLGAACNVGVGLIGTAIGLVVKALKFLLKN